jgi:hypothetical protein
MEKLLKQYLMHYHNYEHIFIDYYNIDGATCEVIYATDDDGSYKKKININVWDMLIFLNT